LRWPWVGVGRLDDAREEIAWLRQRTTELETHLVRMKRVEQGMGELPREKRPQIDPMPRDLAGYIAGFNSPSHRKLQTETAVQRRMSGESWENIQNDILGGSDGAGTE
jgi:hypothetical protein